MKFMNVIKNFKNQSEMVEYRNGMIDKAEEFLNAGDMEAYKAQMDDIETFDNEYKEYSEAQANMAALRGAVSMGNVLSAQGRNQVIDSLNTEIKEDNDIAYRNAFMNFVLKGEEIPAEFKNVAAYTTSSDVGAVIPNTILDRIVEKMEQTGNILNKVTRTFYKGGVTVPVSSAKPVATWTTERGTVDSQKKAIGSITFSYYKLKCVVGVSIVVDTVTLDVFERTIANNIAEAMVKAIETAIIAGTGANQPKGILKETAPTGQNLDIKAGTEMTYKDLASAEGLIPGGYEEAEWFMTRKTYFEQIVGMVDSNKQPVARVNVGIDGRPVYTILGRPVNFVKAGDMTDFSAVSGTDTVVMFAFRMADYILNTNMDITVKHYEDDDTDDKMTKAIMLADGKAIDTNSLVTVTKKVA